MNDFLLINKGKIFGGLIILFVVLVNIFPEGYTILGGDVFQYLNIKDYFSFYHYEFFGRVSLFYMLFYVLDALGVSDTGQLSWYLGTFLFGAYISFLVFCRLLFPRMSEWVSVAVALFYATNPYTLYVFTSVWGFTHYQIVYIFVPILTGLYIRTLRDKSFLYSLWFLFVVFFASMSFGNPAFALSFGIYFLFLTVFLLLSRIVSFDKDTLKTILILVFCSVLLNMYWILPLSFQLRSGVAEVYSSEFINLKERLQETSNAVFDSVRLLPTSEQNKYYPYNFPYSIIKWAKRWIVVLTFIPFFIVLIGLFRKKTTEENRLSLVFFSLFIVFIALVARVRFPFDSFNSVLFQLPGLNVLRGWDKLAIYTPFILSALLLCVFMIEKKKRDYFRWVFLVFCLIVPILALPFYVGGIQTKMSYYIFKNHKNYKNADYSALVKIPDEYFKIKSTIEDDKSDGKITVLPFSPGSSVGRISLPKWKVNSVHFSPALYNKQYVELNDNYIPEWMFAKEFKNNSHDPEWIIDLYGLLGIKYVLYHKDANPDALASFEENRKVLEERKFLRKIEDNDYFILYTVTANKFFPHIYLTEDPISLSFTADGLSEKIKTQKSEISEMRYLEKNRKHFVIPLSDEIKQKQEIVLNDRYDSLWKAVYISDKGKEKILKRSANIRYANVWKMGKDVKSGRIEIYHASVSFMKIATIISGISFLCVVIVLIISIRKKHYV